MDEAEPGRRRVLKGVATTSLLAAGSAAGMGLLWDRRGDAGLATPEPLRLKSFAIELAASSPTMSIVHGSEVERMVRAAVGELGGFEAFIRRGDRVVIKPNVAFDRAPVLGATTNPETLRAVIVCCYEAGAREVVVADNPINAPEGAFYKSGIREASHAAGARVVLPDPSRFLPISVGDEARPAHAITKPWPFFIQPFERADKVIGVAPLKDHNLCFASMTMKNWYGLLGGKRNRFHQDIYNIVSDLALMMTPTLVLLDATRILMRNGPTGGRVSDVAAGDTIIAGVDQVAVDAYGYTLLGRDPESLTYLRYAHERGVGNRFWKETNFRELTV